jgi:hypothetical protein
MGRNARLLTESKLDRRYAAGQWAGLLDEIAAKPEHSTT